MTVIVVGPIILMSKLNHVVSRLYEGIFTSSQAIYYVTGPYQIPCP